MTISTPVIENGPLVLTGAAQVLPFTFKAFTASELEVYSLDDSGLVETIIDDDDYVVTLNTEPGTGLRAEGGSIAYTGLAGREVYIRAKPRETQAQVWNNQGSRLTSLNEGLDRSTLVALRLAYDIRKGLALPSDAAAIAVQAALDAIAATVNKADKDLLNVAPGLVSNIALAAIEISPEDFYLAGDAGDWAPAFARLETFRRAFPNVGTRLIKVMLRKARYYIKTAITFSVGFNHSLNMEGAGYLGDGSRIEVDPTWSGGAGAAVTIQGDAGTATTAQFNLFNFSVAQPGGLAPQIGLLIKDTNAAAGRCSVVGVYADGFKYCFDTTNARLIDWTGCYAWARNIANARGFRIKSDGAGALAGDMTFNMCQTVVGNSDGSGPIYTASGAEGVEMSAYNGGVTRGIRFHAYIGYHGDHGVYVEAGASSQVADWWFLPGCQFDQTVVAPWLIRTLQAGANHGSVFTWGFNECYWTTNIGAHAAAICQGTRIDAPDQINLNSGLVSDGHITHCFIANFSKNITFEKCVGLHFTDNDLYGHGNPAVPLDAIVIYSNCYDVKDRGNVARAAANNITYAVIVTGGGQIEIDGWAGTVTAVRDFGALVRKVIWGRPVLKGPMPVYADNAAAAAAGVAVDEMYRTATGVLMVRY